MSVAPLAIGGARLHQQPNHLKHQPRDHGHRDHAHHRDERNDDKRGDDDGVEGEHGLGGLCLGLNSEHLRRQVLAGDGGLNAVSDCTGQVVWPLRDSGGRNANGLRRCGSRSAKQADGVGFLHAEQLSTLRLSAASALSVKPAQMLEMLTLKERTQQALDAGFSNAQLAVAAGVTSGAVSQWLTTTKKLKAESVIGLARLTGWNAEWWAEGRGPRENVDTKAQPLSHHPAEDAPTASAVGGGQQTISPDEVFKAMSVRERVRFARLLSAAFDDPPEIGVTVEGELWVMRYKNRDLPLNISTEPHSKAPKTVKRVSK